MNSSLLWISIFRLAELLGHDFILKPQYEFGDAADLWLSCSSLSTALKDPSLIEASCPLTMSGTSYWLGVNFEPVMLNEMFDIWCHSQLLIWLVTPHRWDFSEWEVAVCSVVQPAEHLHLCWPEIQWHSLPDQQTLWGDVDECRAINHQQFHRFFSRVLHPRRWVSTVLHCYRTLLVFNLIKIPCTVIVQCHIKKNNNSNTHLNDSFLCLAPFRPFPWIPLTDAQTKETPLLRFLLSNERVQQCISAAYKSLLLTPGTLHTHTHK